MRTIMKNAVSGILALALAALVAPAAVQAQEKGQEAGKQECTAQVEPGSVEIGQSAVRVTANLSSPVGQVGGIQAAEDSGLATADPADIQEKTGMAREEGQQPPQPVEMAAEARTTVGLWLNTVAAAPGSHEIVLQGENGSCTATLEVTEAPEAGGEGQQ